MAQLEQSMYDIRDASRYLRVPIATLRWWLDGDDRANKTYPPVIREQATGSSILTWGEFVEAWYVRQYRRDHGVQLGDVRELINRLRDELNLAYPLAHAKPFVGPGRQLVKRVQDELGLAQNLWVVVAGRKDQLVLTPTMMEFIDKVEFSNDGDRPAVAIHPRGPSSPIVMQPGQAFGSPSIRGIRTESLAELVDAGEELEDVASDFGLEPAELREALSYEWELEPTAA